MLIVASIYVETMEKISQYFQFEKNQPLALLIPMLYNKMSDHGTNLVK